MALGQAAGELAPRNGDAADIPSMQGVSGSGPTVSRVAIVGAGLAGLACAVALAACPGVQVDVFEAGPLPQPAQAGIGHLNVGSSLLRDLVSLGLGPAVASAGFAYQGVDVCDPSGRARWYLPADRLAGAAYPPSLGLRRGTLLQLMAKAAEQRGARLHGHHPVRLAGDGHALQTPDGRTLDAGLVLLATGATSALRQSLFPQAPPPEPLPQRWWYAELPRPQGQDRAALMGGRPGCKVFVLPVSAHRAGLTLVEHDDSPVDPRQHAAHLRRRVAQVAPALAPLMAHLGDTDPVVLRPVHTALLPRPWHRGRVLAVGEAAHALVPQFSHGAAQAVEDACVLAQLLPGATSAEALARSFEQRRADRVAQVHALTLQVAQWDLAPHGDIDLAQLHRQLSAAVAVPA